MTRGDLDEGVRSLAVPLDPLDFRACRDYLRGIDLFNAGFYWESHEAWEAVWIAAGRQGTTAEFLKGLIKLAAAGVKAYEGRAAGVRRHARRAHELLSAVASQSSDRGTFAGLSLDRLIGWSESLARDAERITAGASNPPCPGLLAVLGLD